MSRAMIAAIASAYMIGLGCGPSAEQEEERLGQFAEYCDVESPCRDALSCIDNRCEPIGAGPTCSQICDRLAGECGRRDDQCVASCNATMGRDTGRGARQVRPLWRDEAQRTFGRCFLGQTDPALSCQTIEALVADEDPEDDTQIASFCFAQISFSQQRREACDAMIDALSRFGDGNEDESTEARTTCYVRARSWRDQDWDRLEGCAAQVRADPQTQWNCVRAVLDLSPPGVVIN